MFPSVPLIVPQLGFLHQLAFSGSHSPCFSASPTLPPSRLPSLLSLPLRQPPPFSLLRPPTSRRLLSSSPSPPSAAEIESLSVLSAGIQDDPALLNKLADALSPSTLANLVAVRAAKFSNINAAPPEASRLQLYREALNAGVPFIGFGIMDNMIMILAGDQIDASLGVAFGITTMCAAAIGNILSDLAGVGLGTVIEEYAAMLGLPKAGLTMRQVDMRGPRYARQAGMALGITLGE